MKRIPPRIYSKEFREEAVRLVLEDSISVSQVANQLSLPKSTLESWVRAAKAGKLGDIGKDRRPFTELELELSRVKRELNEVRMERDILKKAAAYFAKGSLRSTR